MDRVLTQRELTIDLSVPAMHYIADTVTVDQYASESVRCEIDNFRNTLLNMIERSVDCASRRPLSDEELCS